MLRRCTSARKGSRPGRAEGESRPRRAHRSVMSGLLLAALLVSATAGEGQTWIVDPGQALVSVDAEPFSAFSHGLEGSITELDDGLNRMELHLPFATLTTGDPRQDARAARDGEAVFQGVAQGNGNRWRFVGMLRFHGISRPAQMEVA